MVLILPLFHKWKYWHLCFLMKYGILCISHTYINTMIFHLEIWNSLQSIYQNLSTNAPSWKLDFGIVHIWRSEWRFYYKKYGNLYILYEPVVLRILPCVLCLHLCLCPLHVCACVAYVCVGGNVHGSCPLQTQRWRWQNMRYGATRGGGMRHSQTRRDWSMHLCDAPVQKRNEERMTGDNSGRWLCKSAVTSRGTNKLTLSAVLYVCISKQWWGVWGVTQRK